MKLSLPDALVYGRIPLVVALALFALYQRPQGCFWVLLLTVALELGQRILTKRKRLTFQPSDLAAKVEPYAEAALYIAIPVVFVRLFPAFLKAHLLPIAVLIGAYLVTELFGYFKFHRLASYQTHGAKLAGICLGLTALTLFWTQKIDWLLYVSFAVALASFAEEVAISAVLPEWRSGVTSLWHAQRIVRRIQAAVAKGSKVAGASKGAQPDAPGPQPVAEVAAAAVVEPGPQKPAPARAQNGGAKKGKNKAKGKRH